MLRTETADDDEVALEVSDVDWQNDTSAEGCGGAEEEGDEVQMKKRIRRRGDEGGRRRCRCSAVKCGEARAQQSVAAERARESEVVCVAEDKRQRQQKAGERGAEVEDRESNAQREKR